MKKLQTYLLSLLIIVSFTACKRDSSNGCGGSIKSYHFLSDANKAKVPYSGTDTLVFVSNANDTAVCIGQGRKQFYEVLSTPVANGDCDPDFDYYEAYYYKFIDKNNLLNITMNIWENDLYTWEVMDININTYRLYPVNLRFLITKYYDDSITINNVTWQVNKIGSFIKYNLQKGIMYCENDNKKWTLIN